MWLKVTDWKHIKKYKQYKLFFPHTPRIKYRNAESAYNKCGRRKGWGLVERFTKLETNEEINSVLQSKKNICHTWNSIDSGTFSKRTWQHNWSRLQFTHSKSTPTLHDYIRPCAYSYLADAGGWAVTEIFQNTHTTVHQLYRGFACRKNLWHHKVQPNDLQQTDSLICRLQHCTL